MAKADTYEAWEEQADWVHAIGAVINAAGMRPRDAKRLLEAAAQQVEQGVSVDAQVKALKAAKGD